MARSIDPLLYRNQIDPTAFVAANATVCGNVFVDALASIWFGAVVRGDTELVRIGKQTNVQDLAVLHADPGTPCQLGDEVTIGHAAVVHGATIDEGAMVGIRAVVLNGAHVGSGSIIGAGAVVTEGAEIPPRSLAVGVPAKVIRPTGEADWQRIRETAAHYVAAAKAFAAEGYDG